MASLLELIVIVRESILSWKLLAITVLMMGTVLFADDAILQALMLDQVQNKHKDLIGLSFLFALCGLLVTSIVKLIGYVYKRFRQKTLTSKRVKKICHLMYSEIKKTLKSSASAHLMKKQVPHVTLICRYLL